MDYVLSFAHTGTNNVLLIEKNRPEWQKGKFNLVGGKIEPGENPMDAALREFHEEAGIKADKIKELGMISGTWGEIYCYNIYLDKDVVSSSDFPRVCDGETLFWKPWDEIKNSHRLMPNLKVIIPLCMAEFENWLIVDEGPSEGIAYHSFNVTVPSFAKINVKDNNE